MISTNIHSKVHKKMFTASLSANTESKITIDVSEFGLTSMPIVINLVPGFSEIMEGTSLLWYIRTGSLTSITIGIKSNVAFSNKTFALIFAEP